MAQTTKQRTCPVCHGPVYPDDGFCEACGHRLDSTAPACVGCGGTAVDAEGCCENCGLRQGTGRDHVEIQTSAAAGVSDRGLRHRRNEDAMAVASGGGYVAAVVSDGVSSSSRPDDASNAAANTGATALGRLMAAGEAPEAATWAAAVRAGRAVAALGRESPVPDAPSGEDTGTQRTPAPGRDGSSDPPSCTYVSVVANTRTVTVGWIGDSRAYWLSPDGDGVRLTEDDSWATEMVAQGALTEAEANAHPNAHAITAWLGADAGEIEPHVRTYSPDGPGVVLVCSDGLWNYYPEAADLARAVPCAITEPLAAARLLTGLALDAGGRDNITVVVVPFPPSLPTTLEQAE
jgi:serine/threonine protein phosphatase PrpC